MELEFIRCRMSLRKILNSVAFDWNTLYLFQLQEDSPDFELHFDGAGLCNYSFYLLPDGAGVLANICWLHTESETTRKQQIFAWTPAPSGRS